MSRRILSLFRMVAWRLTDGWARVGRVGPELELVRCITESLTLMSGDVQYLTVEWFDFGPATERHTS